MSEALAQSHDDRPNDDRLTEVRLDGEPPGRLTPGLETDLAQAVADLQATDSLFRPAFAQVTSGPFALRLSVAERRLVFDIRSADDAPLWVVALALGPFRSLIRDYQMIVDSYADAIAEGREARIQAIDMGRRGVHNQGAELMLARLDGKITVDFDTARRLFTLVCVLHQRV